MASFTNSSISSTSSFFTTSTTSNELSTSIFTSANQVVTVTITLTSNVGDSATTTTSTTSTTSASSTETPVVSTPQSHASSGGLSTGGKVALGVAIPVGVILLACLIFFFFWMRKKRAKTRADLLQEANDYDYNPNTPTPPYTGGGGTSMSNDMTELNGTGLAGGGYRGWGPSSPNPAGASSVDTRSPSIPSTAPFSPAQSHHATANSDTSALDLPPPIPPMAPRRAQARNSFSPVAAAHARSSSFPTLHPAHTAESAASTGSGASGTAPDIPARHTPPPVRNVAARRSMRVENSGVSGHGRTGISANF